MSVPQQYAYAFPHEKLEVHRVALEMLVGAKRLADRMPRGYGWLANQLIRAAGSTPLLIAEGANRLTAGDKRHRFSLARGEAGETASAAQQVAVLRLAPPADCEHVRHLAGRVAAMLTRLIARHH